jgi:carbonic anhydrase
MVNERGPAMNIHEDCCYRHAAGQYPAAVILSCIDSRAPAEIILDSGIGDTFNARIAGNIANDDLIGSLEFACAVAATHYDGDRTSENNVQPGRRAGRFLHLNKRPC